MTFQFSGQSTFVALGKAKHAIFFSIFRKVIIVIPLTILLPSLFGMGVDGVFWAEPISNFVGGAASFITMLVHGLADAKRTKKMHCLGAPEIPLEIRLSRNGI